MPDFSDQRTLDGHNVRPSLAKVDAFDGQVDVFDGGIGAGEEGRQEVVGEAAKRVIECGGSAAVWHSIRWMLHFLFISFINRPNPITNDSVIET